MNKVTITSLMKAYKIKINFITIGFMQRQIELWLEAAQLQGIKYLPTKDYLLWSYIRDHITIAVDSDTKVPFSFFVFQDDMDRYINAHVSNAELDFIMADRALSVLQHNNSIYRVFAEKKGFVELKKALETLRDTYWDLHRCRSTASTLVFARSLIVLDCEQTVQDVEAMDSKVLELFEKLPDLLDNFEQSHNLNSNKETINLERELTIHYAVKYEDGKNIPNIWLSCNHKSIPMKRQLGKRHREFLGKIVTKALETQSKHQYVDRSGIYKPQYKRLELQTQAVDYIKAGTTVVLDSSEYDKVKKIKQYKGAQMNIYRFYQIDHINMIIREYIQLPGKKSLRCFSQHKQQIEIRVNIEFEIT